MGNRAIGVTSSAPAVAAAILLSAYAHASQDTEEVPAKSKMHNINNQCNSEGARCEKVLNTRS